MPSTRGSSSSSPGSGEFGIAGLEAAAGVRPGSARIAGALDTRPVEARADGRVASEDEEAVSDDAAELEAALGPRDTDLGGAGTGLARTEPGRLGQLRRRFHELGAVNPFAVEEYAALKERLETLETQQSRPPDGDRTGRAT